MDNQGIKNYKVMKIKQRRSKMEEGTPGVNLFDLQKNLMQVWQNLNVDEYYQNIMLTYLDSLSGNQAESVISSQIKATHQGSSQYFKLAERLRERKQQLTILTSLISSQERNDNINVETLSEISELLNQLRDNNLVVAEMLINMHRQFNGNQDNVPDQCKQMLYSLDQDNNFLKTSFLNQFILFQQGYDPFFLYHYDQKAKKQVKFSHPIIDKLFSLNISYACRLFKAKTKILQLLSAGKYNEANNSFKQRNKSYQHSKRKINQSTTPATSQHRNSSQISDPLRSTNSSFKRNFSLQKAKQRQRQAHRQPLIKPERFNTITHQRQMAGQDNSDSEEEVYKLVPVKYRIKKVLPRSQHFQDFKRNSIPDNSMKYSLNFKEKLQPINSLQKQQDLDDKYAKEPEGKRPVKQPWLSRKNPTKFQEQEPLQRKKSRASNDPDIKLSSNSQNRQMKMRPGKLNKKQLIDYLKQLDFPQEIKTETIQNSKFQEMLLRYQSYLSQFVVNGQLRAIGLAMVLGDGDYLIKVWSGVRECDLQTNKLLLGKYIDYLQRTTSCNNIYYSGSCNKQLFLSLNFQQKNDKILFRKRVSAKSKNQLEFPQFLSLKCSNILFSQENKSINMLYSDQIEAFNEKNYYVEPSFAEINKEKLNKNIQLLTKISEQISDMKALNSLLEDEEFDTYEVTSIMKISNISAIRLASLFHFKAPFLAGEGYFKFSGEETYRKNDSLVCRIAGTQHNSQVILGKGFPTIHGFLESFQQEKKKPCEFSMKMFNKQLYGRMVNKNIGLCSYGNWEFSFSWKDELQGRVKHSMKTSEQFGTTPFYFAIEIQTQLIFCFQVNNEDFLF